MPLTTEERKELIRTWGDRSARAVAAEFNERHPLWAKFSFCFYC
jgi:hypothetical protein